MNCLYCNKELVGGRSGRKYCDNICSNSHTFKIDYKNRTKLCKRCEEIKSFDDFSPRNKKGDLNSLCKKCSALKSAEHRKKNHESHLEYRRNRRKENPERFRELDKKRREDPIRKISENISRGIKYHISKDGKSTFDILPYTIEKLFERLKETLPDGISWEYYLDNTDIFHIDHIIPQSIYNFKRVEDEEFLKCWDLNNLRIISKKENISKNGILFPELVKKYNIEHLLPKGIIIE